MSGTITSTIGQISAGDRTITLKLPDGRVHYWDAGILLGLSPLNDQTKKKIAAIVEVIEQAVPQNTRYLAKRSQKRLTLIRKAAARYLRYSRTERAALLHLVIPEAVRNGIASLAYPVVQDWVTQVQFRLQGDLITLRVGPLDENAQLQAEKSIAEAKRRV